MTGGMDMQQLRNMGDQALKRKALETGTEDSVAIGVAKVDLGATAVVTAEAKMDLVVIKVDSEEVKAMELVVADLVVIAAVKEALAETVVARVDSEVTAGQ